MQKSKIKRVLSDHQLKIRLYAVIFIVLSSVGGLFLLGWFGLNTLSSLRAFVGGESLYSMGTNNAVSHLQLYAHTRDRNKYQTFLENIRVPLGDKKARLELEKPNPDLGIIRQGFREGGNHPDDIDGMISVYKSFRKFELVDQAIQAWTRGDALVSQLEKLGEEFDQSLSAGKVHQPTVNKLMEKLDHLDHDLDSAEMAFSAKLGEVSRWAKGLLAWVMFAFAVVAGGTCLILILFGGKILTNLKRSTDDLTEQNRIKTGQAVLNEQMRGAQIIKDLAARIVGSLCEYLKADLGALYLLTEDQTLRLKGSYAFHQHKDLPNEFRLGEGLVGQAALEKKPILLTNCPADYLQIQSGLGSALPRNILIFPLLLNNTLQGVLELGAFKEFSEKDRAFLEEVAESIAMALQSELSRGQLAQMLGKTQEQAEELQAQQEELRAANEELEEQTKALQASEELLQTQQEELRATNEELVEQTKALEKQKQEILKKESGDKPG